MKRFINLYFNPISFSEFSKCTHIFVKKFRPTKFDTKQNDRSLFDNGKDGSWRVTTGEQEVTLGQQEWICQICVTCT